MADVIYKRSFLDKVCRTVVGAAFLYVYTKGVVALDDYRDSKKTEYSVIEVAGDEMLMYNNTKDMVKIDENWFNQSIGHNGTNDTFKTGSIDDVFNRF